ncbi:hypothetical protein B566_EDAN017028 [Ephemera danica]|nr:hypothetical protein B566_EDAN017028 [Ephemera danica]
MRLNQTYRQARGPLASSLTGSTNRSLVSRSSGNSRRANFTTGSFWALSKTTWVNLMPLLFQQRQQGREAQEALYLQQGLVAHLVQGVPLGLETLKSWPCSPGLPGGPIKPDSPLGPASPLAPLAPVSPVKPGSPASPGLPTNAIVQKMRSTLNMPADKN